MQPMSGEDHDREPYRAYGQRPQQLSEYDARLLLDRTYVHPPVDGFGEENEEADETGRPVRTSWAVLLYLVCLGAYLAFLFVDLPDVPPSRQFAIKASAHTLVLLCALLLEVYLRCSHRRRQQAGYLRFYRRTRHLLSIPFQAAALCSVALLMAELWPHSVRFMTHIQKLIAVTMAECVVALIFALVYLWRIQHEALPDGQLYLQSALYTASDSRIRHPRAVVEQQCEVIHFLQRRCDNLAHAVLRLQAHEDRAWEAEGRVDSDHRAAAREAELRALRAEKEALSQQNRRTWSLLEERTNENHQLVTVKQQHAEENARLRATLEEWSHRNTRLEHRLNTTWSRLQDALAQIQVANAAMAAADWQHQAGAVGQGPGGSEEEVSAAPGPHGC